MKSSDNEKYVNKNTPASGELEEFKDPGEVLASLLVDSGALTAAQLKHAQRIREKLSTPKTLLTTLLDLEFVTAKSLSDVLKENPLEIFLGELLVELGDITSKELTLAIKMQSEAHNIGKKLGTILVEKRFIKEKRLLQVLSKQLGVDYIKPDFDNIDKELLKKVTPNHCEQYEFIPIGRTDNGILVASPNPSDQSIKKILESLFGEEIIMGLCGGVELQAALYRFKKHVSPRAVNAKVDESDATRIVDQVLREAIKSNTSDIHIEPSDIMLRIRFRTDSVLWQHAEFPIDQAQSIIARLKVLSKANVTERRRHQDGKIEYTNPDTGQMVDVRCSFYINVHGEKACLRLLNRQTELLNLEEIGMAPAILERFKYDALDLPSGVTLVTGPTGSGKTTTLYSCVDYLNNDDTSIITAEEPVEYVIRGITQCSLNPKIEMTFAETLRHMVRQDPDVIVLGEIRDQESAEAAIQSALTGHKVLTTFHTEDTIGGLLRLMNMNIETFLISSTVVSVLAQRLLRKICSECTQPYRPSPIEIQRVGLRPDDLKIANFRRGHGCPNCNYTGYSGRVSVFELLVLDEKIKQAIISKQASYDIRRISIETSGLVSLREDGLEKASRGLTTISEVLRMLPKSEPPRPLAEIKHISRIDNG